MTYLINDIYAVEAQEGATGFFFDGGLSIGFYLEGELRFSHLPSPGNWQLICTTKECTEEQAKRIVDAHGKHFRDYSRDFHGIPLTVFTAPESLETLLASKNLDPENKNYVLIKKLP